MKKKMFSRAYFGEIRHYFENQMRLLEDRKEELSRKEAGASDMDKNLCRFSLELLEQKLEEIRTIIAECTQDEAEALQFLYSAMPLSDILNYPAALYLSYAKHGVFLWKEGPFAGRVPERIFANYVLHHRVHNEDIADTRGFFYHRIRERIAGKDMYGAAVETNYWCAEKATYQSTFMRTQNPITMYRTAIGRCGEEAPFAVTALRSVGIPAREVSTPLWAHCDDNHAWVEAWCDGKWHYLGGCEPEKTLDKGWFSGPACRAMMVESRWFGKEQPQESALGRTDMSAKLNHLGLYARTLTLKVKVEDEKGNPAAGAKVDFAVLNHARFGSVASIHAGTEGEDCGIVRFETGFGDLLVCAWADGCFGETHVSLVNRPEDCAEAECTVVLKREMEGLGQWREMDFHAPREVILSERKTEEEAKEENDSLAAAAQSRKRREEAFYKKEDAERVIARFEEEDRGAVEAMLRQARGNMGELVRFLEWDFKELVMEMEKQYGRERWKLEALKSLKKNDYWDIKAEVLAECCICAAPYAAEYPEEVFFSNLLAPSAMFEIPETCRAALAELFTQEQKDKIRKEPKYLAERLESFLVSMPEQEYANLVTLPMGCLTGGFGNEPSRNVLCIQIYRALGIPARMRPMDRTVEYYAGGEFVPVSGYSKEKKAGEDGRVVLTTDGSFRLEDWKQYSLSKFENGRFMPMFMRPGKEPEAEGRREFRLKQGIYRAVTTNRLPNGDQFVRIYDFALQEGEEKKVTLGMRGISMDAILSKMPVEDFALTTAAGDEAMLSSLGGKERALLVWLELSREPTEHILNELCEKSGQFAALTAPIYFVLQRGTKYDSDVTFGKTCEALPQAELLFDDFDERYEKLSRQVKCNPGKLPLAMVLEGKDCIYSNCGYNVGMADMLYRVLTDTDKAV